MIRLLKLIILCIVFYSIIFFLLLSLNCCYGDEIDTTQKQWTDTQIVNAIYNAEGGCKTSYLYGIRSVKYTSPEDARRICFNTVHNNRKRYAEYGYKRFDTYLEFLASRYCPVGCVNDIGTNQYWLKNVKWFLNDAVL